MFCVTNTDALIPTQEKFILLSELFSSFNAPSSYPHTESSECVCRPPCVHTMFLAVPTAQHTHMQVRCDDTPETLTTSILQSPPATL